MSRKIAALVGLDGSGKSANINKLKTDSAFQDANFIWARYEPTLLLPIYRIMSKVLESKRGNNIKKSNGKQEQEEAYNTKSNWKKRIFRTSIVQSIWINFTLIDYKMQLKNKMRDQLQNGRNIVFDRYYIDLFIDQGINFGYSPKKIAELIKKHEKEFLIVDKYIYIKVSPKICYMRKNDIPSMDYLNKRYEIYEELSKAENWITVDGELNFETVNAIIKDLLLK